MVDSISTNRVHVTYIPSHPFPVRDVVLIPGLFLHGCEIKSRWGLGTRLTLPNLVPRPSPHVRERGSGVLSNFSCQMGRGSSLI